MADETARSKLLVFDVGAVTYAVDVGGVREVLRDVALQPVPSAGAFVVGALEHRGDVIPVIDLRVRFGVDGAPVERHVRCIVVHVDGSTFALLVDRVIEVWDAEPTQRRELPQPLGPVVHGVRVAYSRAGRLVFVLDTDLLAMLQQPRALVSELR